MEARENLCISHYTFINMCRADSRLDLFNITNASCYRLTIEAFMPLRFRDGDITSSDLFNITCSFDFCCCCHCQGNALPFIRLHVSIFISFVYCYFLVHCLHFISKTVESETLPCTLHPDSSKKKLYNYLR